MVWTHASLERPLEYSVDNAHVFKGQSIIANLWQHTRRKRVVWDVVRVKDASLIGTATSPAEGMLMAIRDQEGEGA